MIPSSFFRKILRRLTYQSNIPLESLEHPIGSDRMRKLMPADGCDEEKQGDHALKQITKSLSVLFFLLECSIFDLINFKMDGL